MNLMKTILVEQIASEEIASSNLNPYNTSTLMNEENLYFYKRVFKQPKAGDDQGTRSEMQLSCLDLHTLIEYHIEGFAISEPIEHKYYIMFSTEFGQHRCRQAEAHREHKKAVHSFEQKELQFLSKNYVLVQ